MGTGKWIGCLKKVIKGEGCELLEIIKTRKHLKIYTLLPQGEKRMFVTGVSPSDNQKVLLNFRGDVRRAVKHERENDKH